MCERVFLGVGRVHTKSALVFCIGKTACFVGLLLGCPAMSPALRKRCVRREEAKLNLKVLDMYRPNQALCSVEAKLGSCWSTCCEDAESVPMIVSFRSYTRSQENATLLLSGMFEKLQACMRCNISAVCSTRRCRSPIFVWMSS